LYSVLAEAVDLDLLALEMCDRIRYERKNVWIDLRMGPAIS